MSSFNSTLSQITHYQKKLGKYAATGETEKVLGCIHKLKYLPVTVSHLEKTGVGKSINALRHRNGIIGEKARALVNKWKTMVDEEEQEEPAEESQNQLHGEEPPTYTPYNHTAPACIENEEEEYDPSDEGGRLQIQEEQAECEEASRHITYNPGGNPQPDEEDSLDQDNVSPYDPRTSRHDYVSIGDSAPSFYTPSSKVDKSYSDHDSLDQASLLNGDNHTIESKKTSDKHLKSENEGKHKKKKQKSKDDEKEKHKSRDKSSSSSQQKSKHKDKSNDKESDREKENGKSKRKLPHSSHLQECEVSSTTSPPIEKKRNQKPEEKREEPLQKSLEPSHSRDKERSHSHSREKKSHKSGKSSKDEDKSTKRKREEPVAESSSGFEAALMGMDSTVNKKKKKKKSKDKEHYPSSSPVNIPPSPTNHTLDIQSDSKSSRSKLSFPCDPLNVSGREYLPQLPSTFEDDLDTPQLMPNYKPLPQVPQRHLTKDPCNNSTEEALNFMLSSKNNKQRRIYAGKCVGLSCVPSLFEICIRVLQENIDAMEATGGIPFDLLRSVLEKANPQQLASLEDYNPYLLEDTDILWASHCKRRFKSKQREDFETWRELFFRCMDEQSERIKTVMESLQEKYVTKAPPKRTTRMAFIHTVAKPPKSVARAQAKYGTASSSSQVFKPSKSDEPQKSGGSGASSSNLASKPDRPFPSKPIGVKKRVAPLMGKARQLLKSVCRR